MSAGYYRSIIVFKQERQDYSRTGRTSTGRCLIEARGSEGRIVVHIQDLKPEIQYKLYIIALTKNDKESIAVCVGSVFVDEKGKGESSFAFDANNVFNSSLQIRDFRVAAIVAGNNTKNELVTPLVGFKDGISIMWRINLKFFDPANPTKKVEEKPVIEQKAKPKKEEKKVVVKEVEKAKTIDVQATEVKIIEETAIEETVKEEAEPEMVVEEAVKEEVAEPEMVVEETVKEEIAEPEMVVEEAVKEEVAEPEIVVEQAVKEEVVKEEVVEPEIVVDEAIKEEAEPEIIEEATIEKKAVEEVVEIAETVRFIKFSPPEPKIEQTRTEKKDPHEIFRAMAKKFNEEMEALTKYTFMPNGIINENSNDNINAENRKKVNKEMNEEIKEEIKKEINIDVDKSKTDIDLIFEMNTKMTPFVNQRSNVIWVRTCPEELAVFPFEFDKYINHPFVMLAYKNFKHLIMGKAEIEGKIRYILGVPDIFSLNKKDNAAELGFMQFKSCSGELSEGEHGYWLLVI